MAKGDEDNDGLAAPFLQKVHFLVSFLSSSAAKKLSLLY